MTDRKIRYVKPCPELLVISGNKEIGLGTKIYIQPSPAARHRLRRVGAHLAGGGGGEGRVVGKQIYPALVQIGHLEH